MEIDRARTIAENLMKAFTLQSMSTCERIEIAGSIRWGSADVHDIELVAMPILKSPRPQFGEKQTFKTLLDKALWGLIRSGSIEPIKGGDKYKQFWLLKDKVHLIKVDLFLVTPPAQWGVQMVIRTGPNKPENNFSQWMVTHRSMGGALPDEYLIKDGAMWMGAVALPTPKEEDFFIRCGLKYIEPSERVAKWKKSDMALALPDPLNDR